MDRKNSINAHLQGSLPRAGAPGVARWLEGHGRMKANRGCAEKSGSYEDNSRIPIWLEGYARGCAF